MRRKSVDSSNLRSVGYDEKDNILEIEFHSGGIYQYYNVDKEEYLDLMDASSHGRYFMSNIRGAYEYWRVK